MLKALLILSVLVFSSSAQAEINPLQRIALITDFETWLGGGESLFDWSEIRSKEIQIHPNKLTPTQVQSLYTNNIFAAEKHLSGRFIQIEAFLDSVERGDKGSPVAIFKINSLNRFYSQGFTIPEAQDLSPGQLLRLYCIRFEVDSLGDMSATCSQLDSVTKFIAANNIQHPDNEEKVRKVTGNFDPYLSKMIEVGNKDQLKKINTYCQYIDSRNYDYCKSLFGAAFKHVINK